MAGKGKERVISYPCGGPATRAQSSGSTTRDFEAMASTLQALQDTQIDDRLVEIQDLDEDSIQEGRQGIPVPQNTIQKMLDAILQ